MSLTSPTEQETAELVSTIEKALPQDALAARVALGVLLGQFMQRGVAIGVLSRGRALDVQTPGRPQLSLVREDAP